MAGNEIWVLFGRYVAEARNAVGMTQARTARAAGMTRTHLADIEGGRTGTRRDTVLRLANALQIDAGQALRKAGFAPVEGAELEYEPTDERFPQLQALYSGLGEDDRDDLIELALAKWRRRHRGQTAPGENDT